MSRSGNLRERAACVSLVISLASAARCNARAISRGLLRGPGAGMGARARLLPDVHEAPGALENEVCVLVTRRTCGTAVGGHLGIGEPSGSVPTALERFEQSSPRFGVC